MSAQIVQESLGTERRTYTIREIAPWLGISINHAYLLANAGPSPFPVVRLGRRLVVPAAAFDRWLENAGELEN